MIMASGSLVTKVLDDIECFEDEELERFIFLQAKYLVSDGWRNSIVRAYAQTIAEFEKETKL